jgi:hypothetical protein
LYNKHIDSNKEREMGYRIVNDVLAGYGARKGLEGPFNIGGRVLYYDVKEGSYYDPKTDFYVPQEDVNYLHNELMRMLDKQGA